MIITIIIVIKKRKGKVKRKEEEKLSLPSGLLVKICISEENLRT